MNLLVPFLTFVPQVVHLPGGNVATVNCGAVVLPDEVAWWVEHIQEREE